MIKESETADRQQITELPEDDFRRRALDAGARGPESPPAVPTFEDLKNQELDPNFGNVIRVGIQLKAKVMFDEALKDPNSDAGLMIYIMVVNQLATMKAQFTEEELKEVYNEELRRFNAFKRLEIQRGTLELTELKLRQTTERLNRGTDQLNKAHDVATIARRQLDSGEEVDMREICGRIADIVGLRPPPQPGAAQPGPQVP